MNSRGYILAIDDTQASLRLLVDLLSPEGYEVRPADSGELALASVAARLPELILLDIRMPGMDGFEVLSRLKQRPESSEIPVIFLSAITDTEQRVEGLKLGAVDFVSKPFQREELLARVQTHLESRRMRTDLERQAAELARFNDELEQRVVARTAELGDANRELAALVYSMSHDLRTPLRGIDGFSLLLLENYGEKLDHEGHDHLVRIRRAAQKMGAQIDELVELSLLGRSTWAPERVDLSELARSVAAGLREAEPERTVELVVAEGLQATADPRQMRILLANLIGNAWKFTARHEAARIEVGVQEVDGERVLFVRDDGAGFDMAYADKLFGAFEHVHSPGEFEGLGMGLAAVERIVRRHGGRVWAEGEVEKGATFWFTLPDTASAKGSA